MGILNDHDPVETQEWVDSLRAIVQHSGRRPRAVHPREAAGRGATHRRAAAVHGDHAVREHHPAGAGSEAHLEPRAGAQGPLGDPLERGGDHPAREQGILRARRPHRELPVLRAALRHRLRPFLARADGRARRRPDLRPGPRLARHLCPRLRRRAPDRGAAPQLPPGDRRQGHPVVSAPVADAGLLAVPHRVDGARPADGDLPGALPEVPRRARPRRRPRGARCGRSSATASATSPSRSARSRSPGARSSTTSIFVINCNLQRLDGPVRGNGKIVQELEGVFRGAGWNVIKVLWGSTWDKLFAKDKSGLLLQRMEECVDGEYQDFKSKRRRLRAQALLRQVPGAGSARRRHERRRDLEAEPRRSRPVQGVRRLLRGGEAQGPADRDPRQDGEGLRHGRVGRRPDDQPPGEEDDAGLAEAVPRPLPDPGPRRPDRRAAVPQAARGQPGGEVPQGAAHGARRLPAAAPAQVRVARGPAARQPSSGCSRARRTARSPPRWRSCRCSARWCATRTSASTWCRSCRTSRAPSAWKACSGSSASGRRSASSTSRRTPTS